MDIVWDLVEHVVRTKFEDLSSHTVEGAKRFILDTLGVGIAGSSAPGAKEVVQQMTEWGESAEHDPCLWEEGSRCERSLCQ